MSSSDKAATAVHGEREVPPRASGKERRSPRTSPAGAKWAAQESQGKISLWQLNLLRVGYLVMGGGLAVVKWPLLFTHGPWELKEGTVECMLVAMSVLAFIGLRYPLRMLPVLLFEVAWKLTWLGVIALPLWSVGKLDGATRHQAGTVVWVVVIIAVIPWRHVLAQYVMAPGEPWRRSR